MKINRGYEIKRSVLFENDTGFALGHNPKAPNPFVTWKFNEENGRKDYYWGHYKNDLETATRDYEIRIAEYQGQYKVSEKGAYKYYSTQRPVDINTFPKTENGPIRIANFDVRESVESGSFKAWGFLIYDAPLTEKQIADYELRAAPDNPDILKDFEKVVTEAVCEEIDAEFAEEQKTSIYEQMEKGAVQAAKDNAARQTLPKKKEQDISD